MNWMFIEDEVQLQHKVTVHILMLACIQVRESHIIHYFQRFSTFPNYCFCLRDPEFYLMRKFDAKSCGFDMAVNSLIFYEKKLGNVAMIHNLVALYLGSSQMTTIDYY